MTISFRWESDPKAVHMAAFTRADPADRAAFDALPRTGNDTASAGKARGTLDVSHGAHNASTALP